MGLSWLTADARHGRVIEELPGALLKSSLQAHIGRGESVTVELPLPDRFPERWRTATQPNRSLLACIDDRTGAIWWAGLIVARKWGHGPSIEVTASAPEQLLERTYVPEKRFEQASQNEIMRWLGLDWLATYLHGRVEQAESLVFRDRAYGLNEDKTRLSAMQDLMKVIGGPEFCTSWEMLPDGTLGIVATAADRLGLKTGPDRVVDWSITPDEWTFDEDYSSGKGATVVTASTMRDADPDTADAAGAASQEKISVTRTADDLLAAGWLPLEERFSPETGSTSTAVIAGYADGRLAALRLGTRSLSIKCLIGDWPLNAGVRLGDDIEVDLTNPDMPAGERLTATCRVLGWAVDVDGPSGEVTHVTPSLDLLEVSAPW